MLSQLRTPQPHLRISIEIPPPTQMAHAVHDRRITLPIYLSNDSGYPAQFPFLCVMDLGLNLLPESNWMLSRITSDGRKLLRCAFTTNTTLMPGDRLHAASLIANVVADKGLRLSFNGAAPMPVETLRDLKLFTVSGAANFPSERGSASVSADGLRRALLLTLVPTEPRRIAV